MVISPYSEVFVSRMNRIKKLRAEKNAEFQSDVIRNRSFDATSSDNNKCNVKRYSSKNVVQLEITIAAKLITEGDGSCNTTHHVLTVPPRCSQQELVVLFERQCGLGEGSIAAEELFVIDQNAKYLNKRVRGENSLLSHRAKKAENNFYTFSPSDEIVVFTKAVNVSRPSKRCNSPSLSTRSLTAMCSNLTPHKFSRIDDTVIPDDSQPISNKQEIKNKSYPPPLESASERSCTPGSQLVHSGKWDSEGCLQFPNMIGGDLLQNAGDDAYCVNTYPAPSSSQSNSWIRTDAQTVDNLRLRPQGIFRQLAISPGIGCSDYHYNIELESVLRQELEAREDYTNSGDGEEDAEDDDDDVEEFKSLVDYISRQLGENMIAQSLHGGGGRNTKNESAIELNYAESESLCSASSSSSRSGMSNTEPSFLEDLSYDDAGGEFAMRNHSIVFAEESEAHPAQDSCCDTSVMLSALGMKVSVTLGTDGRNVSAVNLDDDSASNNNTLFGESCFYEGAKNAENDVSTAPQYLSDLLRSVQEKCDELLDGYLFHGSSVSSKGDNDDDLQQQQQATTELHGEQETSNQRNQPQLAKSNITLGCKPVMVKEVFLDLDDLMNNN